MFLSIAEIVLPMSLHSHGLKTMQTIKIYVGLSIPPALYLETLHLFLSTGAFLEIFNYLLALFDTHVHSVGFKTIDHVHFELGTFRMALKIVQTTSQIR